MPSLQRMHQIGAAQPRAQAKLYLLMTELKYGFLIGLERLHRSSYTGKSVGTQARQLCDIVAAKFNSRNH